MPIAPKTDFQDPLLEYELMNAKDLIIVTFRQSGSQWFSLRSAVEWAAKLGDMEQALMRYEPEVKLRDHLPLMRKMGQLLRYEGLYVGNRKWMSGEHCTPVWADAASAALYIRDRAGVETRSRGDRAEWDKQRQWRPE